MVAAAGGLPGEVNVNWLSRSVASFDCEYGFSCMGYEIAGAWGAALARHESPGEVFALVGDGSYLMLNSEIYSSVLSGKKMVVVVCDNGGFAVIERLQKNQGGNSYNNMLRDSTGPGSDVRVDFVAHAASLGAHATRASSIAELEAAIDVARAHERTSVIVVDVRESTGPRGVCSGRWACPRSAVLRRCARPGPPTRRAWRPSVAASDAGRGFRRGTHRAAASGDPPHHPRRRDAGGGLEVARVPGPAKRATGRAADSGGDPRGR